MMVRRWYHSSCVSQDLYRPVGPPPASPFSLCVPAMVPKVPSLLSPGKASFVHRLVALGRRQRLHSQWSCTRNSHMSGLPGHVLALSLGEHGKMGGKGAPPRIACKPLNLRWRPTGSLAGSSEAQSKEQAGDPPQSSKAGRPQLFVITTTRNHCKPRNGTLSQ